MPLFHSKLDTTPTGCPSRLDGILLRHYSDSAYAIFFFFLVFLGYVPTAGQPEEGSLCAHEVRVTVLSSLGIVQCELSTCALGPSYRILRTISPNFEIDKLCSDGERLPSI